MYHLICPRILIGFGELVFLTNSSLMRHQIIRSNTCLQIILEITSLKGYPVNIGVHQGLALGPTLFLPYITRGISKLFFFNFSFFFFFNSSLLCYLIQVFLQAFYVTLTFFAKHEKHAFGCPNFTIVYHILLNF